MLPAPPIDDLAERIRARTGPDAVEPGLGPYILFVGEALATAAGAPSRDAIAREALRTFGFEPSERTAGSPEDVLSRFAAHTASLSGPQFVRMLRSLYATVPVPSFYQELAPLIREGYFPLIITTNFDTLLEQALTNGGIRRSEYKVTTFDARRVSSGPDREADRPPVTHIVKLHGDLAQDTALVTPSQIQDALRASSRWIKADLRGDMIMVGHLLSDDPIDRWLAYDRQRELWWVGGEEPTAAERARIETWAVDLHWIVGDLGRPAVFLGQLAMRLRSRPAAPMAERVVPEGLAERSLDEPDDVEGLAAALGREIVRTQSVLYNLDQEAAAGERPAQLDAQIRYQKKQIVRLENRVHTLPEVQHEAVAIVSRIADRLRTARLADERTFTGLASYVDAQLTTLNDELGRPAPNQVLVAASLGATLTVADRLLTEYGTEIVQPEDVRRLAKLVPSAAGKVVL